MDLPLLFEDFWGWNPATTGVVGFLALWILETGLPFVEGRAERIRHAGRNLTLTFLNAAMLALVFSGLTFWVAEWAHTQGLGLLNRLAVPAGSWWMMFLAALLLLDAWMYLWHRAVHRIPVLWRFHRVHHSDPALDVTTSIRFHFGEIAASAVLRVALIPIFGFSFAHLVLYDLIQLPIIQIHHSNLQLPPALDRLLRVVIVTPNMHRVHHSRVGKELNSNYSSIFSLWDRMGKTFRLRPDPRTLEFGLPGFDSESKQSVWGLLRTPFLVGHPNPSAKVGGE